MRQCGTCTLCCKLERVGEPINKPRNVWCDKCTPVGCSIYSRRPQVCRDFQCEWLKGNLPEEFRPDRVGLYVRVDAADDPKLRVVVCDPDKVLDEGLLVLKYLSDQGLHSVAMIGRHLTFLAAENVPPPEKLMIAWVL
jgi:hypothetical protein